MSAPVLFIDGKAIRLGKRIGKGGEGEVYLLADDPKRAIKVYTLSDLASREAKIKACVRLRLGEKSKLIAFPLAIASDRNGRFAGFVMHCVHDHQPLFELYSPGARKQKFPQASYKFVVRAALNIARAVAVAHDQGCVIGDINHSGILISKDATAALIDADSFQISDGTERFLCRVGVPEYTPPELQNANLSSVFRTPNHDAFGLAIVIFQLLAMGRHPFVGSYARGEMPIEKAISDYRFAYSQRRQVGMTPPPGACTLRDFPSPIAEAFEAAFSREHGDARPTALQWVRLVEELENSLISCSTSKLHHYSRVASECPWCRLEKKLGVVLFVSSYTDYAAVKSLLNAAEFNLSQIWAHIEALKLPPRSALSPKLPVLNLSPSPQALEAKKKADQPNLVLVVCLVAAAALFLLAPVMWFIAAGIVWFGFAHGKNTKGDLSRKYSTEVRALDEDWRRALEQWSTRLGLDRLDDLKALLQEDKRSYEGLKWAEDERVAEYKAHRQEHQLNVFLDRFRIRDVKIKGIGLAKLATLASYGIETAADVTVERILRVPGFGPSNSKSLHDWKRECSKRFTYNTQPTPQDQIEIGKIYAETQQRAKELQDRITNKAKEFLQNAQACKAMLDSPQPQLTAIYERRIQIEVDCAYLGIHLPTRPSVTVNLPASPIYPRRSAPAPTPFTRTLRSPPSPPGSTPQCPQCGTRMVRRTARRGYRAGRPFWGCARYPSCRGTRPI